MGRVRGAYPPTLADPAIPKPTVRWAHDFFFVSLYVEALAGTRHRAGHHLQKVFEEAHSKLGDPFGVGVYASYGG